MDSTVFCTLEGLCATSVVATANPAHSVPTLRTVTMSKEQEEFRRKGAVTFEALWWC